MLPVIPQPDSDPKDTKAADGPASEADSLVRLEWFASPFAAQAAKLYLEQNGIRVSLTPEGLGKPDGPAYLEVLASQAKQAKRLLQQVKK